MQTRVLITMGDTFLQNHFYTWALNTYFKAINQNPLAPIDPTFLRQACALSAHEFSLEKINSNLNKITAFFNRKLQEEMKKEIKDNKLLAQLYGERAELTEMRRTSLKNAEKLKRLPLEYKINFSEEELIAGVKDKAKAQMIATQEKIDSLITLEKALEQSCLDDLTQAISYDPENPHYYYNRALCNSNHTIEECKQIIGDCNTVLNLCKNKPLKPYTNYLHNIKQVKQFTEKLIIEREKIKALGKNQATSPDMKTATAVAAAASASASVASSSSSATSSTASVMTLVGTLTSSSSSNSVTSASVTAASNSSSSSSTPVTYALVAVGSVLTSSSSSTSSSSTATSGTSPTTAPTNSSSASSSFN